jgi:putative transposase
MINLRRGWRGNLWQERFQSFVMDEPHLLAAARDVERNPVRAGLCPTVDAWPWSSARAHLQGEDDELVRVHPMLALIPNWAGYLADQDADNLAGQFHRHARTGRPLGSGAFVADVETRLGRVLSR